MADLAVLDRGDVLIDADKIAAVGQNLSMPPRARVIEAAGRVLMPGFVDCHTHACWAGDRIDEWGQRLAGADYLDILKAGGGIMATVRAVRASTEEGLMAHLRRRLDSMLRLGSTTVEIKSGYGLSAESEIKMLRAIERAHAPGSFPLRRRPMRQIDEPMPLPSVITTALLGHAIDPEVKNFVDRTISETLPAIHKQFPGIPIDAFCESGAWSVADTVRLLSHAKKLGHPLRVHADQFNDLGMTPQAVRLGAVSVDHLEASSRESLDTLAASATFGVILPCCGLHLDGRYANVRRFVSAGGLLALATNLNPGSAPCPSMPMAVALAVRHCGISPAEAIIAATVNPATLLGLADRGTVAPGQRADLILLKHSDERALAYEFGDDPVDQVVLAGRVVKGPAPEGPPGAR
jgi:imidazolonepropionase